MNRNLAFSQIHSAFSQIPRILKSPFPVTILINLSSIEIWCTEKVNRYHMQPCSISKMPDCGQETTWLKDCDLAECYIGSGWMLNRIWLNAESKPKIWLNDQVGSGLMVVDVRESVVSIFFLNNYDSFLYICEPHLLSILKSYHWFKKMV